VIPRFFLLVLVLLLGLPGCAFKKPVVPLQPPEKAWLARVAERGWRLQGRIGVRSGEGNWHGGLRWFRRNGRDSLTISGPFGQGGVKIEVQGGWIRIRYHDGRVRESRQPQALLEEALGVRVPLRALHYWVLGMPAPGVPVTRRRYDSLGRLRYLNQSGWQIEYREYTATPPGALPRKIVLTGPAGVVLKLIVDRWETDDASLAVSEDNAGRFAFPVSSARSDRCGK